MNILLISNIYPPYFIGGYELGCKQLADGLASKGHNVTVLTSPSHYREMSDPTDIKPLEIANVPNVDRSLEYCDLLPNMFKNQELQNYNTFKTKISNLANTSAVLNALDRYNSDCVYLFNIVGLGGIAILDVLNTKNVPWVFHLMDRVPEILQNSVDPAVLSIFNSREDKLYENGRLISMTKHLVNEIETLLGFSFKSEIDIVPGWVNTRQPLLERNYQMDGITRFVNAGAMKSHKGIDLILEAASKLKNTDKLNFSVDLYGDGDIAYFTDKAINLNVADLVTFHGPCSQNKLLDVYRQTDAFLFPTWEREPFGFAPVEAASMGCVPIITNTCGVAERLIDQVNCFKIRRTAESLYSVMKSFCKSEVDYSRVGRNCQEITRQDLSFEYCLKKIDRILQEHVQTISSSNRNPSNWRDYNLAQLKHNLSLSLSNLTKAG